MVQTGTAFLWLNSCNGEEARGLQALASDPNKKQTGNKLISYRKNKKARKGNTMGKSIIKKLAGGAVALVMLVGVSSSAFATIWLGVGAGGADGDHILGEVIPPVGGNVAGGVADRDAIMINTLLGVTPLGSWQTVTIGAGSYPFYRSTADFGPLPAADVDTAFGKGGIGDMDQSVSGYIKIELPDGQTYQYLIATYDNTQSGAQVWYIGDVPVGETILIPRYADNIAAGGHLEIADKHQITTWTMYNPVPEPTTMIAGALLLLPFAASTVRFVRKNRKA